MSLWQMSVSGAAVIGCILLIRVIGKEKMHKSVLRGFWLAAVARLWVPLAIPFVGSPLAFLEGNGISLQGTGGGTFFVGTGWGTALLQGMREGAAGATPAAGLLPAAGEASSFLPTAGFLWAAGVVLGLLYLFFSHRSCRRRYADSLPVEESVVARWLAEHPLKRRVEIRVSDRTSTPLTYGILRPVILLPKGWNNWQPEELGCVLLHEWVHIRRFDPVVKLLLALTLCLHWPNPFVWAMCFFANRDIELACDARVISLMGESKRLRYARTLLQLQEWGQNSGPLCSSFCRHAMEERITAMVKYKKISRFATILAVFLLAGAVTVFAATVPAKEAALPSTSSQAESNEFPMAESPGREEVQGESAVTERPEPDAAVSVESREEKTAAIELIWPVGDESRVTSGFGSRPRYERICIGGVQLYGNTIAAAAEGVVTFAGWDQAEGNCVMIAHEGGWKTVYLHCRDLDVVVGETVSQGQRIASLGATGRVTGPCLGFMLLHHDTPQDPMNYFIN